MPKLTGAFALFPEAVHLSADDILKHLSFNIEPHQLENFLANRILYPQSIPPTKRELSEDLGILKALLDKHPTYFYDKMKNTLTLPDEFILRFPPLQELIINLLEVLPMEGVSRVQTKDHLGTHQLGSIVTLSPKLEETVVRIGQKELKVKKGSVSFFKLDIKQTNLIIDEDYYPAFGGKLGVVFNFR